jgi:hypothetical protein
MSDNTTGLASSQGMTAHINLHELELWVSRLGCTEAQLRVAVAAVGQQVEDVCSYLGLVWRREQV